VAVAALCALIPTVAVVGGSESASAFEIDCSYSPGLVFAVKNMDGVSCQLGTGAGFFSAAGLGGFNSSGLPGGDLGRVMDGRCRYDYQMPEALYSRGPLTMETYSIYGHGPTILHTDFYRDGKFVAERDIYDSSGFDEEMDSIRIRDYTAGNGIVTTYEGSCLFDPELRITTHDPFAGDTGVENLAPGATPTPTPTPTPSGPYVVDVATAALTPIAGKTNEFSYRVTVTNSHADPIPVGIHLDLENFEVQRVATLPAGASCPSATAQSEFCVVDQMAPSTSATFTFLVKAKPTMKDSASIGVIGSQLALRGRHSVGASFSTSTAAVVPYTGHMTTTSFITPDHAATVGREVIYGISVRATTAGTPIVALTTHGLDTATEASLPTGWVRTTSLDSNVIVYKGGYVGEGEIATLSLHFKVSSLADDPSIKSFVNGVAIATDTIPVRPDSPSCTGSGTVPPGGQRTLLEGVTCSVPAGTTLAVTAPSAQGGALEVLAGNKLAYTSSDSAFTGQDGVDLVAVDAAGRKSSPISVPITVTPIAVAVDDDYTTAPGTVLTVDAGHGILTNDTFHADQSEWTPEVGYGTGGGALTAAPDGSFTYTPRDGFTGTDVIRYRLGGRHGAHSAVATITIHVTP